MNDAALVCGFQRFGNLAGKNDRLPPGQLPAGDPIGKRLTFHELQTSKRDSLVSTRS